MSFYYVGFMGHHVMLHSSCGGATEKLNTCCQGPSQITDDRWLGVQAVEHSVLNLFFKGALSIKNYCPKKQPL